MKKTWFFDWALMEAPPDPNNWEKNLHKKSFDEIYKTSELMRFYLYTFLDM